jgi:hypothetical protein
MFMRAARGARVPRTALDARMMVALQPPPH